MNPPTRAVYIPPRPNLGPEAGGTPGADWVLPIFGCFLILTALGLLWFRARTRRGRRVPRKTQAPSPTNSSPASPREQVIAGSEAIRAALVLRLGTHWHSRTTEEIMADPGLADVLPAEAHARLELFLRLADRAKFAEEPEGRFDPESYGEDWAALVGELLSLLEPEAGASSKTKG